MNTTIHQAPPTLRLDIYLYLEDGYWVGHCFQLDILAADKDRNAAFAKAKQICLAQILFAVKHDKLESLFRPPNPKLLAIMKTAKEQGMIQLNIEHMCMDPIPMGLEFQGVAADTEYAVAA